MANVFDELEKARFKIKTLRKKLQRVQPLDFEKNEPMDEAICVIYAPKWFEYPVTARYDRNEKCFVYWNGEKTNEVQWFIDVENLM